MTIAGLIQRFHPLARKVAGKLPLCPWASVLFPFNPRILGVVPPPMDIRVIAVDGDFKKLCFAGRHEVWFPAIVDVTTDMWGEYLCVFWNHPKNAHYYLRHTPIQPGDICVDCGTCEGFFVFQALEGGAAKVICIEAGEVMTRCLARTFEREIAAGRVLIRHAALGALNGTTCFNYNSLNPFGGSLSCSSNQNDTVIVRTLECLLAELEISRIDFIKMDIEGAEIQALEGAMPVLHRDHPRLAITTYHRSFDYAALRVFVLASGYNHIKPCGIALRQDADLGEFFRTVMLQAWLEK